MIREKELRSFKNPYRGSGDSGIDLQKIQNALQKRAASHHIPLAFYKEQIKSGGVLNTQVNDCIVLYHPEHQKDYYRIAISIRRQVNETVVYCNDFGESKNLKKLSAREPGANALKTGWKQAGKEGNWSPGMSLMTGVLVGAAGALKSLGGSKEKQELENAYYAAVSQLLDEVLCH